MSSPHPFHAAAIRQHILFDHDDVRTNCQIIADLLDKIPSLYRKEEN